MCGIAGIVSTAIPVAPPTLAAMLRRVRHRGPDDAGTWISPDGLVGLAHARLSILDLSPAGHQPMSDAEQSVWIVFNGEIYNFQELREELESRGCRFVSHSDTEVIIHAYRQWGRDCFRRFNGMFAVALFDQRDRRLVLARDRVGKKPIYVLRRPGLLAFASESEAFSALTDLKVDLRSLNFYLAYGYLPRSRSIFRNVEKLLPGQVLTCDLTIHREEVEFYWQPPSPDQVPKASGSPVDFVERLQALLEDSVRLRLIADVPLGVLLSGGVDSSLVTAVAARVTSKPLKTFTATFPGGGRYDEGAYARLVARHFGTEHHELPLEGQDFKTLERIARHIDEPIGDPSILPTYALSCLIRQHVTVALGGDGGDELFGGYGWYQRGLAVGSYLKTVPQLVRRTFAGLAEHLPAGFKGRSLLTATGDDLAAFRINTSMPFDAALRQRVLRPEIWQHLGTHQLEPEFLGQHLWPAEADPLTQMSMWDLRMYLPEDILTKVDRASMAVALEVRAPWLDYRIAEFALREVPTGLKARKGATRILQRQLAAKLLPRDLDIHRKQGFVMPTHQWLIGGWAEEAGEALNSARMREWFDARFVSEMMNGLRKGYTNGVRLFTLLMLALWLDARTQTP